jgi:FlaA1/EpsC-like NDP-sugar epimerase
VTGGAGSIGSEIVRQLCSSGARAVIVFDSWEEGVFNLTEELQTKNDREMPKLHMFIGNVRDKARLDEVMKQFKINAIIHAAAYKHVHLMEANPGESKKTNVGGTKNVLDCAVKYKIRDFVLISTDKAVNPANVMGASKRAAELLMKKYAMKYEGMRFCAVRFGNVLNSSGSMLPKFLRQIRSHSAITITDKEMTRYFMSIPEAVSLVLMSWIVTKNGQVLLLDMGKPIKILDLAETLIKLHGLTPYIDIPISEIGKRPGEKIHEELSYDAKKMRVSPDPRIFIVEDIDSSEH